MPDDSELGKDLVGAIIVAAGSSQRMGGVDKTLAPLLEFLKEP